MANTLAQIAWAVRAFGAHKNFSHIAISKPLGMDFDGVNAPSNALSAPQLADH